MGAVLPPEVEELISRDIDSVVRLEVLLQLHANRNTPLTAEAAAEAMRIDAGWARAQLEELRARGFVRQEGASDAYLFAPATEALAEGVDALARAYADRRVAVISTIYSRPADPLRSFTDAFNLRRRPEDNHG